jgi:protoheme IX farnesyltransferase
MVVFALKLQSTGEGAQAQRAAQRLFSFSILYLFVLFAVLLIENAFGVATR